MNNQPRYLRQAALICAALPTFTAPIFCPAAQAQKKVSPTIPTMQWQAKKQTIDGAVCFIKNGLQPGPTVVIVTTGVLPNKAALPDFAPAPDGYAAQQVLSAPLLRGKIVVVSSPNLTDAAQAKKLLATLKPDWLIELRDDKTAKAAQIGVHLLRGDMETGSGAAQKTATFVTAPQEAGDGEANTATQTIAPVPTVLPNGFAASPLGLAVRDDTSIRAVYAISAGKATHFAPSVRTRFLRRAASRLLQSLQMEEAGSENALLPPGLPKSVIRVAMYDSDGATGAGPANLEHQISAQPDMVFRRVCAGDIQSGVLKDFDVVIHPGGSGTGQGRNLGPTGLAREKAFIGEGGGYIGICGGDYLASNSYPWSLGCVDADVLDRPHWLRGKANLQMELTPKGREIFGDVLGKEALVTILYHNGPVLSPNQKRTGSNYEPLAVFKTEIAAEKGVKNIMVGSAAIAADQMGKGRVLGISPHPEQTPGMEAVVPRAVRWVARRPLTPK